MASAFVELVLAGDNVAQVFQLGALDLVIIVCIVLLYRFDVEQVDKARESGYLVTAQTTVLRFDFVDACYI